MQLKKQVKTNIYVAIIAMIILLVVFLLLQNITAPTYNNGMGQAVQQVVAEQSPAAIPVAETNAPAQNNETLPPQAVEPTEAEQDTATVSAQEPTELQAAGNKKIPVASIVIAAVVIVLVVGIYFGRLYFKNRSNGEEIDDSEQIGEPERKVTPFWKKWFNHDSNDSDEEADEPGELLDDGDNDHVSYEEGRGYYFKTTSKDIKKPHKPDEPQDGGEDYNFDYSEYGQDDSENDDSAESDQADELELCREIERLTDKVNDYAERLKKYADNTGLKIQPELVAIEESDEMPAGAGELQQEVTRLKNRINAQVDYIEEIQKNQGKKEEKADNNNNKEPFLTCVANALSNMQQKELVYKPQRQRGNQDITYVPSAEFFDILSKTMPGYEKKNVIKALIQHEIIYTSGSNYDTVYNKKRALKVDGAKFLLLTTEIAEDVGA